MPIYEFRCTCCDRVTEKISNSKLTEIECPKCQGKSTRIVSMFSGQPGTSNSASESYLPGSGFT